MKWKKTVLVIDDSTTVLKLVGDMLVDNEYQPILTSNMDDALSVNLKDQVDVAIVDLVMPGMDGLQGIKTLRKTVPNLRIIAMSAGDASMDSYSLLRIARRIGADAVIKKPFNAEQLDQLLQNIEDVSGVDCIRILAIDDSKTICKAISDILDDPRYRVTTANSANEALSRSDILGIDVVLTDIFMPGESGIDVIEKVRENWPEVRIIAMSAGCGDSLAGGKALEAARRIGAMASLQKPFKDEELISLMSRLTMDL